MLAASTTELTLRMIVALALVGGTLIVVTRFARGRLRNGAGRAEIDVRGRHQLTKSSAVAVVTAGQRHFLIGVNEHAITLLAEGDDLVPPADIPVDTPGHGVIDVRAADGGDTDNRTSKDGARKRRRGASRPAPAGTGVIEALRERTTRRS